jgi:hypothetical protein
MNFARFAICVITAVALGLGSLHAQAPQNPFKTPQNVTITNGSGTQVQASRTNPDGTSSSFDLEPGQVVQQQAVLATQWFFMIPVNGVKVPVVYVASTAPNQSYTIPSLQGASGGAASGQAASDAVQHRISNIMIQNHAKGDFLGVQGSTLVEGQRSGDGSFRWIANSVSTADGTILTRLRSAKTGDFLSLESGALALVKAPTTKGGGLWKLEATSDGSVRIHNAARPNFVINSANGQVVLTAAKAGAGAAEWKLSGDAISVTLKPLNSDPVTAGTPSVKITNKTAGKLEIVLEPNNKSINKIQGNDLAAGDFRVMQFPPRTELGFYDPQGGHWLAGSTYFMAAELEQSIEVYGDRLSDLTSANQTGSAATATTISAAASKNMIGTTISNKSGGIVYVTIVGTEAAGQTSCQLVPSEQMQTLRTMAVGESYTQPLAPGTCLMFEVFEDSTRKAWIGGANAVPTISGPTFVSMEVDKDSVRAPQTLHTTAEVNAFAQQVLQQYIQNSTSTNTATFCWRDSKGRGVGTIPGRVADCPAGYTNNGLTCGQGADTISAPSQGYANCPSPYVNSGFNTCIRFPDSFWQCGGTCRDPYYHASVCTCQYWGDSLPASSMVCPAGYSTSIIGTCIKNCPPGYTNTGETCFRGVDTLGLGSMTCRPGEVKGGGRCFPSDGNCGSNADYDAGLCYGKCGPNQDGVGPVCWDRCPSVQGTKWVNCGAGCARDKSTCDQAIINQVTSPVMVAGNVALTVVTAGGSVAADAAEAAVKTGAEAGGEAAAKAAVKSATEAAIKTGVRGALQKAALAVTTDAGRAALVKEVVFQTAINTVITTGAYVGTTIYSDVTTQKQVQDYVVQQLASNTDPKVVDAITTQVMSGMAAQNPGSDFPWASLDPTGVASMVEAYNYPLCSTIK